MPIQLMESLVNIALGIRFRANFSIEDQLGQIVDRILYSKDSFFNPKIFPSVAGGVGRKVLINNKTADQLTIDNSNIILEINFVSFSASDVDKILFHFENDIIKGILKEFAIKEIVRIGFVNGYIFKMEDLAKKFVDKTIGRTLEGVNDIQLTFSKKLPILDSLVKKGVNDYDSAIFTVIKKADLNEIFMSLDYQRYYEPFLSSASGIDFGRFIGDAEEFNNRRYLLWLNKNYLEAENG